MSRLSPLALLLVAVPLAAQNSSAPSRGQAPVNVIRPVTPTGAIEAAPPAAPQSAPQAAAESHTIFWNGNGGYVGDIAGAGAAVSSGGSALPQSYGESRLRTTYLGSYPIGYGGYSRRPFQLTPSQRQAQDESQQAEHHSGKSTSYGYKPWTFPAKPAPTPTPSRRSP
jgi:hypothetical protein